MTKALIKRKLEEQKENFRRRQGDDGPPNSQPPSTQSDALGPPLAAKVLQNAEEKFYINDLPRWCHKPPWRTPLRSPSLPPQ